MMKETPEKGDHFGWYLWWNKMRSIGEHISDKKTQAKWFRECAKKADEAWRKAEDKVFKEEDQ